MHFSANKFLKAFPWRWFLAPLLLVITIGTGAVYYGSYNVSALTGHTDIVYQFLEYARIRAVKVRAPDPAPNLAQLDWRNSGFTSYEKHCLKCHGAPGIAPESFALGMMPPPSAIVRVARNRSAEELYWVIENGIKMSGMPAWKYRLNEVEIWELVSFLKQTVLMTKKDYLTLRLKNKDAAAKVRTLKNIDRVETHQRTSKYNGRVALQQYNCSSCHVISGMPAADYHVGPPLTDIMQRRFIAGILPMSKENLIEWIMNPPSFKPNSTMPNLSVTRKHAELMVEYLTELKF